MIDVLFTAPVYDSSGYGEASRNYIGALLTVPDINLGVKALSFEEFKTEQGQYRHMIDPLIKKEIAPRVQIIHATPGNFRILKKSGIRNIGYAAWETTVVPSDWVDACNCLDEIWVPCDWNVEVFKNSGVTVPVRKIHHTINFAKPFAPVQKVELGVPPDYFKFYSIFQWSARKNPEGLIRAYVAEFSSDDNVCLVLKTYIRDNSENDKNAIRELIGAVKSSANIRTKLPPICLIHGALSREAMLSLHSQCDAFVLPHRAEGWGIPLFEAMMMKKPVIATGFSGNLEFMDSSNSRLIPYQLTPVSGMDRDIYNGRSKWAEPDVSETMKAMREIYETPREILKAKADFAKEGLKQFSWESVGRQMRKYLLG